MTAGERAAPARDAAEAAGLDEDAKALLAMMREAGRRPYEEVGAEEGRRLLRAGTPLLQLPGEPVGEVLDLVAEGPGGALPLRLYRSASAIVPTPTLLFFHGGGWVVGDLDTHDPLCRSIANAGSCAVLAVDYRRAPECRFPAAVEDAIASHRWLHANAPALGLAADRLGVGGDSAGGGLAAAVAQAARRGDTPPLRAQILAYPVLDLTMASASYARFADGTTLTRRTMLWFRDQYLAASDEASDPRASPLLAGLLAQLPPTLLITAGHDPVVDDAERYAERLLAAGTSVERLLFPGQVHGFLTMSRVAAAARPAVKTIGAFLRRAL